MEHRTRSESGRAWYLFFAFLGCGLLAAADAMAITVNVQGTDGGVVGSYRWLLEEDNTNQPASLSTPDPTSLGVSIAKSHAPAVAAGTSSSADLTRLSNILAGAAPGTPYFLSVMPDTGYAIGGAMVAAGDASATIKVNPWPLPTAQMRVMVFEDNTAISGGPELPAERGLPNFLIHLDDVGGEMMFDVFGNPLCTTYQTDPAGNFIMVDGSPVVDVMSEGCVTDSEGIVIIKNLAPGTYMVWATPRDGQPWIQTSTIGGGFKFPVVIRAGEPPLFAPGGLLNMHAFIGFLQPFRIIPSSGPGLIQGTCVNADANPPPQAGAVPGDPITDCYVGLNSIEAGTERGLLFQQGNSDGTFSITGLPLGTYQLITIDRSLSHLMTIRTVVLTPTTPTWPTPPDLGLVTMGAWAAAAEGHVFLDDLSGAGTVGVMDPGEPGLAGQAVVLRAPDGSILQATETDTTGAYSFPGVPPAGKWAILEVDFARLMATGGTFTADRGAGIPLDVHTETGVILLEGMISNAGQLNIADWGKAEYGPGVDGLFDTSDDENGGITGIVYNDITRAENDPRLGAGEPWETGVPNAQVNLYQDTDPTDGMIDDVTGDAIGTPADVDNYPLQWTGGGLPGPEDIDWNGDNVFDGGDAIQIVWSDSFDDNPPTGCARSCNLTGDPCTTAGDCPASPPGLPPQTCGIEISGTPIQDCAETLQTWNQMRPALFDGGYAVDTYFPLGWDSATGELPLPSGIYIVEAAQPAGYEHWKEEDKNVDFGDEFAPTPALLPPPCVGADHLVPQFLSKDGVTPTPDWFPGMTRPLCDRKQVSVTSGQNAVADFHLFTQVPKAGRIVGQIINLNAPQTNPNNPNFGGFLNPGFLPVSIQDHEGNEIVRVYADAFGAFNALAPSTHSVHIPSPSGVSPGIVTICPNHPGPIPDPAGPGQIIDPQFNPSFGQLCFPFDVWPGRTTYAVTPIEAVAAVAASSTPVDCEFPDGTPVIEEVNGLGTLGAGPVVRAGVGEQITITSPGTVQVPDPSSSSGGTIPRDFGFGTNPAVTGNGRVTVGGTDLVINTWTNTSITATVPAGVTTGQLVVTRDSTVDNGLSSIMGITLHVDILPADIVRLTGTIQAAINSAPANALVLVPPGTYAENLIIDKPIRLQGYGAWSTTIDAGSFVLNEADWTTKIDGLSADYFLPGQRTDFLQEKGAGITVLGRLGDYTDSTKALIDGLTITRAIFGGGVFVNGHARYLTISNNRFLGNQGSFGGGIRLGWQDLINDTKTGYHSAFNEHISIHHNHLNQNGSMINGGGICINKGADNYAIIENFICGNYTVFNGAGIAHFGLSPGGIIADNYVLFNESFGEGGGISITGQFVPVGAPAACVGGTNGGKPCSSGAECPGGTCEPDFLSEGTGSVTVDGNLIQGNLAGDDGGGISVFSASGQDVATNPTDPTQWYRFDIINNIIVNNVSGFAAAGIALADVVGVRIVHNTIARNDSTAIAAFQQGQGSQTTPQGAGIVARPNSPALSAASGESFADPVLANDIIWHNRSFYFDATLRGGLGDLAVDPVSPYWDLQVFGQPPGMGMNPVNCILSPGLPLPLTDAHDPLVVYDPSNLTSDPLTIAPYDNTIELAPNIIAPIFSPRTLTGDYHVQYQPAFPSNSPGKDMGDPGILGGFGAGLAADYDAEARPAGAGVDIGADEVPAGTCSVSPIACTHTGDCPATETCTLPPDIIGPATRDLSAAPNPTDGAPSVNITATAYDTGTGGSFIAAAEWSIGPVPAPPGAGTPMVPLSGSFNTAPELTVTATLGPVPPLPPGDFTVWVRSQDNVLPAGNWGPAASALVRVTAAPLPDALPPRTANISATPNPTAGATTITIAATAYDTFTGGSDIAGAEWWTGLSPIPAFPIAVTNPMLPADGTFDSPEENVTADIPLPSGAIEFYVFIRSQDVVAPGWGDPVSILVRVTSPDSGTGHGVYVQCPGDADGDAIIDAATNPHVGDPGAYSFPSNARCAHLSAGDGFANMADGTRLYTFSFADLTGIPPDQAMSAGSLAANFPAPRLVVDELDELYLNLTNVGMMIRPDLFDPHTVHWHGFPQAASIFDGVPDASIAINMGSTLTYFYKVVDPGTYMYHCHVEATEHMQMGMLGNLYVRPAQNRLPDNWCFSADAVVDPPASCAGHRHSNPDWNADRNLDDPLIGDTYAYNDGDGSTYYDVEYPIQIGSFDPDFHNASENVQPLPFALMKDKYPMLNGRGYPDTMIPGVLWNTADVPRPAQPEHSRIEARIGEKILLRISNLNVTRFYTLATLGIPMTVVGKDARLLRGPGGQNLYYQTNSVDLGGGEAVDAILDTTGVPDGTYFLYTTNLESLCNNEEDIGGMMTEILITP